MWKSEGSEMKVGRGQGQGNADASPRVGLDSGPGLGATLAQFRPGFLGKRWQVREAQRAQGHGDQALLGK